MVVPVVPAFGPQRRVEVVVKFLIEREAPAAAVVRRASCARGSPARQRTPKQQHLPPRADNMGVFR